ncbi:Small GTPase superfamily, ARF/SAR type like protein [Aduncisulcus paluster]|uniref:Small GTPase superfamily, ARF/SAR type like protein n=1 Tax=Aduncisulcus paluster TaxID=2918883 RepID=A0ABQ5KUK5_9EUKA|nr:Small GTPase superfamily, ARF/SAR type like protein [Aduncisulcus paluster]
MAGLKPYSKITPTLGQNQVRFNTHGTDLSIFDLSGHPSFISSWSSYYHSCTGVIFVIDTSESLSMPEPKDDDEIVVPSSDFVSKVSVPVEKEDIPDDSSNPSVSPSASLELPRHISYSLDLLKSVISDPSLGCIPIIVALNKTDRSTGMILSSIISSLRMMFSAYTCVHCISHSDGNIEGTHCVHSDITRKWAIMPTMFTEERDCQDVLKSICTMMKDDESIANKEKLGLL